MAIKELITLEGAQEVKKTLADLGKSGEDFVKKLNSAGGSNTPQLQQLAEKMKQGAGANTEHARSVHGVRDAYHLLHPVLQTAGIQISELRGFAVLASAGLVGLGAAITATVIIALSKLADQARVTRAQVDNLLNIPKGAPAGQTIFKGLEDEAKKLGTTVEKILPVVAAWVGAAEKGREAGAALWVAPPGEPLPAILGKGFAGGEKAALTFIAALRAGGETEDQAAASAKAFGDALGNSKNVTGELVRSLNPLGAGVRTLQNAFGLTGLTAEQFARKLDENPKTIEQLIAALARLDPEIRKTLSDKSPTQFSDALGRVAANWARLGEEVANSDLGVTFLKGLELIPIFLKLIGERLVKDFRAAIDAIKQDFADARDFIINLFANFSWDGMWEGIKTAAQSAIDWLSNKWNAFLSWLRNQSVSPQGFAPGGGGGEGIPPFASGGLFRGRGGIDTNLAWLTDLEYIIRPAAVRKYGTRVFDWLNSLQMPVGAIPGFAEGGLNTINNSMVTITGGGTGQRPFVLNLPGFGSFRGSIAAPDQVVDALSRASAFEQLAQGGRSPGWRR